MENINIITFLGWCTVINFILLLVAAIAVIFLQGPISKIHSKLFDIKEKKIRLSYYNFLANYKMLIIVFNLVPYIALKIITTP